MSLHGSLDGSADLDADVLALDEALNRLAGLDERQARVAELRCLGGLSLGGGWYESDTLTAK